MIPIFSAFKNWFFRPKPFAKESITSNPEQFAASESTPASYYNHIKVSTTLHQPLLDALRSFERTKLSEGMILFHGCNSNSPHTEFEKRCLIGTRKWFSQDASYAVDYAGPYNNLAGKRLLWICSVKAVIPALAGSQSSLQKVSPWNGNFPWKFPNAYEEYARCILETNQSVALLDHQSGASYKEILITSPSEVIQVIEVREVPEDIADARKLGADINTEYSRKQIFLRNVAV